MLSRKAEDYLEIIFLVSEKKGYARPRDIVRRMGISYPSATEMLKRLNDEQFIDYEKYGEIKLTPQGLEIAKKIRERHEIFEKFLKIILVSEQVAQKDACVLEHHLDQETIRQLSRFVNFAHHFKNSPEFFKNFESYCRTGRLPKS